MDDEVLLRIPTWRAKEKMVDKTGSTPTELVGQNDREAEKAIHLGASVKASAIAKTSHTIDLLEPIPLNPDRNEWRNHRVAEHQRTVRKHFEEPGLADGWLPKTQIESIVKRIDWPRVIVSISNQSTSP